MPSEHQAGKNRESYETTAARMLHEKPKGVILSIKPQSEENAREWLGESNRLNASDDVIDHFVDEIKRFKDD